MGAFYRYPIELLRSVADHLHSRDIVESFRYIDLKGRIDLKDPDLELVVFEDCKSFLIRTAELVLSKTD